MTDPATAARLAFERATGDTRAAILADLHRALVDGQFRRCYRGHSKVFNPQYELLCGSADSGQRHASRARRSRH